MKEKFNFDVCAIILDFNNLKNNNKIIIINFFKEYYSKHNMSPFKCLKINIYYFKKFLINNNILFLLNILIFQNF